MSKKKPPIAALESKVTVDGTSYHLEVSNGVVDVYNTMLGGIASSSLAGEAYMEDGKLLCRESRTLTNATWDAIEAFLNKDIEL
jgi:hypothetical protein